MPDGATPTIQNTVVEALVDAFDEAREMAKELENYGIEWVFTELDINTGKRPLAIAIVGHAIQLDPQLSHLRQVVIAALRARRGRKQLVLAAASLGIKVPAHLRERPDHVLRLTIAENGGRYEVCIAGEPENRARPVPFDKAFEDGILRLADMLGTSSATRQGSVLSRGDRRFDRKLLKALGDKVFEFLLPEGSLRDSYVKRFRAADKDALRLQVMLDTREAPSLTHIPWELAFDPQPGQQGHLCLRKTSSLARYVDTGVENVLPSHKLSFLGFIAATWTDEVGGSLNPLQADRERDLISQALKKIRGEQRWATLGTLAELTRVLESREPGDSWSVFHFIGHGGFDAEEEEGFLLLQSAEGPVRVSAEALANRLVVPGLTPQLVVLNCCSGATAVKGNRFSSFAETLVLSGIRAVIGMQFPVTDPAAQCFSESFYEDISEGRSVQVALNRARLKINEKYPEWVTPALFTSSADFVLVEPDLLHLVGAVGVAP